MINIHQFSSPSQSVPSQSMIQEDLKRALPNKSELKKFLIESGVLNQNYLVQDSAVLPPLSQDQLNFEPLQAFLNLELDYAFTVDEKVFKRTQAKLLKFAQTEKEVTDINCFLASIKDKIFQANISFREVLKSYAGKSSENLEFEIVGGWFLHIITQSDEIFEKLLRTFFKANHVIYEGSLKPHTYRYRPELDLKIYLDKDLETLFKENDRFYESFIGLFATDSAFDPYFYRILFQQFTLRSSPAFPNTALGHHTHKLDVLFVNENPTPLMATDKVTFNLKDKVIFPHFSACPVEHEKFKILEFNYQNLKSVYQCMINLFFGIDQVNTPAKVNDKAIPRLLSRMSVGFYFPQNELIYLLKHSLKGRSLETLFIDYHENHHEGNDELFMGFLLNSFLALKKISYNYDVVALWKSVKPYLDLNNLKHPLLKSSFILFEETKNVDLLEKFIQFHALFGSFCKTSIEEFEQEKVLKVALTPTVNVFVPFSGIDEALSLVDVIDQIQLIQTPRIESEPNLQTPLTLDNPQTEKLLKKLAELTLPKNENKRLFYNQICESINNPLIHSFAKKILKHDFDLEFVQHFIANEISYPTAFSLYKNLNKDKQTQLYNSVVGLLAGTSLQLALKFIIDSINAQLLNRTQITRIFKFYNSTQHHTKYLFFKFLEDVIPKIDQIPGEKPFFDALHHILIDYINSDRKRGIAIFYQIKDVKELSEISQNEILNQIRHDADQIALQPSEYEHLNSEDLNHFLIKLETTLSERFLYLCYETPTAIIEFFTFLSLKELLSPKLFNQFLGSLKEKDLSNLEIHPLFSIFINSINTADKSKLAGIGDNGLKVFEYWIRHYSKPLLDIIEKLYQNKIVSKKNLGYLIGCHIEHLHLCPQLLTLDYLEAFLKLCLELNLNINPSAFIDTVLTKNITPNLFENKQFLSILTLVTKLPKISSTSLDNCLRKFLLLLCSQKEFDQFKLSIKKYEKLLSPKSINRIITKYLLQSLEQAHLKSFFEGILFAQGLKSSALKISSYKLIFEKLKAFNQSILLENYKQLQSPSIRQFFASLEEEYVILMLDLCEKKEPLELETLFKFFQKQNNSKVNLIIYEFYTLKLQAHQRTRSNNLIFLNYLTQTKCFELIFDFIKGLEANSEDLNPYNDILESALANIKLPNKKSLVSMKFFNNFHENFSSYPHLFNLLTDYLATTEINSPDDIKELYFELCISWLNHHMENTPLETFLRNQTVIIKAFDVIKGAPLRVELLGQMISSYFLAKKTLKPPQKRALLQAGLPILTKLSLQNQNSLTKVLAIFAAYKVTIISSFISLLEQVDLNYKTVTGFSNITEFLEDCIILDSTDTVESFKKVQQLMWLCNFLIKKTDCQNSSTISKFFYFVAYFYSNCKPTLDEKRVISAQYFNLCRTFNDIVHDNFLAEFVIMMSDLQPDNILLCILVDHIVKRAVGLITKERGNEYYKRVIQLVICYIETRKIQHLEQLPNETAWGSQPLNELILSILKGHRHFFNDKTIDLLGLIKYLLLEETKECAGTLIFINTFVPIEKTLSIHDSIFSFFKKAQKGLPAEQSALKVFLTKLINSKQVEKLKKWLKDPEIITSFPQLISENIFDAYR